MDSLNPESNKFLEKLNRLNQKIFGSYSMPAPKWVFAHNICVSGVAVGFMKNAEPLSLIDFIPTFAQDTAHVWTFMLSFDLLKGIGFGKMNFALLASLNQNKKYLTYITQGNNSSILTYLHSPNPTILKGIGFFHTHENSILLETRTPKNPFISCMKRLELKDPILFPYYADSEKEFVVSIDDRVSLQKIMNNILNGGLYEIIGWRGGEKPLYIIRNLG
ncbi:MAG: hypothetical protein GXO64_02175 [Candidatus Micrarchaeota archaeon]|nr:hypothetical protein [Candidatus Micrarchaeota archaeon]